MTLGGYMGKWLFADLSEGVLQEETLTDDILRQYVGG